MLFLVNPPYIWESYLTSIIIMQVFCTHYTSYASNVHVHSVYSRATGPRLVRSGVVCWQDCTELYMCCRFLVYGDDRSQMSSLFLIYIGAHGAVLQVQTGQGKLQTRASLLFAPRGGT